MRTESGIRAVAATNPVAASCIELTLVAESCKWFPGLAKWLSPTKPATLIHYISGEPERSCYAWVEGKNDPPARAIVKMLHSSEGSRVLDYLMRGSKQPWWLSLQRARAASQAYDAAAEQLQFDL